MSGAAGWKSVTPAATKPLISGLGDIALLQVEDADLAELARDAIAKLITARFKGHGLLSNQNAIAATTNNEKALHDMTTSNFTQKAGIFWQEPINSS